MRRKIWLLCFCLIPTGAYAQVGVTYVFTPPANADLLVLGGASLPMFRLERLSLGPGGMIGAIRDEAQGEKHWHLTWMVTATATYWVKDSWGVTAGYGWGFVHKSAKPRHANYESWLAGVTFGF